MLRLLHPASWVVGFVLVAMQPALTFECVDYARMGTMLGQMDRQCPGIRLTEAGRKVVLDMAKKQRPVRVVGQFGPHHPRSCG